MICILSMVLEDFNISMTRFLKMDVNEVIDVTNKMINKHPDNCTLLMSKSMIVHDKATVKRVHFA